MKRSAPIKPKAPPRRPVKTIGESYTPKPRECARNDGKARMTLVMPRPKDAPVRDEAYRRRVAALPCAHCGRPPPSQCAHADEGKGMGIKSSDLDTYPACADAPGRVGCHSLIGASGMFTREQRRHLERTYAERTRENLAEKRRIQKEAV